MIMKKYMPAKILAMIIFLLIGFSSFGQTFRKYKRISDSFKVTSETELNLSNKYGNIQLITWDRDEIKFEVKIEVRDKKEAKAEEKLESIHLDFVATEYLIEAKTYFTSESEFWTGVKDYSNRVLSSDNKTSVNYLVYLPKNMPITITNKYGDIYIGDCFSRAEVTISNGDLKAHSFQNHTTLNMEFAYANIKQITDGNLNLGYHSEVIIGTAKDLKIKSKSSRVTIQEVDNLRMVSDRDKYFIRNVNSLNAENNYTYLNIENLNTDLKVNAKYGDIDIIAIQRGVVTVDFTVKNCDINLVQPQDREIDFDLVYDSESGLYFPGELENKKSEKFDKVGELVKTNGTLGTNKGNTLHVKAKIISGNIRVANR